MQSANVTAPAAQFAALYLEGRQQYDEHCKGWRWHMYVRDDARRMEAVRAEMRKILAERRAHDEQRAAAVCEAAVRLKVQARSLCPGDQVGSGETVIWVGAGVRTPRGKVEVVLEKGGSRRTAIWGAYTEIGVRRAA